ncbi:MAG TPA: transketolase [Actinomycetota bacterium]|nr:transketolase [Actinomycetota bacterium]
MPEQTRDAGRLEEIARDLRVDIIRMLVEAKSGHPGGSLSEIDILTCLFFGGILHYKPDQPDWPDRDRFLLSKGHCTPGLYTTMARAGYFPAEELMTFRKLGSRLQGHPDRTALPGIEVSAGSLGQGLSVAVGMALAARMDGHAWRTFCMMGDGEQDAGQVWEAAMAAGDYGLGNLVGIVDCNQVQQTGLTKEIMTLEPIVDRYRSFGWHVIEFDGHDIPAILGAFDDALSVEDKPAAMIARTVKGKGVSWMELNYNWHGKAPSVEEGERAIAEILGGN